MTLRKLLMSGALAIFGVCVGLAIAESSAAQNAAPPKDVPPMVARFQLAIAGPAAGNYMTDTVTGDCWNQINNGEWTFVGNPRLKAEAAK